MDWDDTFHEHVIKLIIKALIHALQKIWSDTFYCNWSFQYLISPSFSRLQPGLAKFQAHNQPEFIRRKAAEELAKSRGASVVENHEGEPENKKTRRSISVDPLDRPSSASPLPDLPDDLRQKQVWKRHFLWGKDNEINEISCTRIVAKNQGYFSPLNSEIKYIHGEVWR